MRNRENRSSSALPIIIVLIIVIMAIGGFLAYLFKNGKISFNKSLDAEYTVAYIDESTEKNEQLEYWERNQLEIWERVRMTSSSKKMIL